MSRVNLDAKVFNDPRFIQLAKLIDPKLEMCNKFEMIGRMSAIWLHCTEFETYFLTPDVIDIVAGIENFHKLILDARVDLAEITENGIRIKGTNGRIEWIQHLRINSKKGGAAKAAYRQKKDVPTGTKKSCLLTPTLVPVLTPTLTLNNTALDFEKLYEKYPKKEGKGKGLIIAKRDINTLADFNLLETAIEKYSAKCKKDRTESRFIKQFSTFMNSWRDWIEPDAGEVKFQKKHVMPEKPKPYELPEKPFTPEQQEANKKRIADLMNANNLGGWSKGIE